MNNNIEINECRCRKIFFLPPQIRIIRQIINN